MSEDESSTGREAEILSVEMWRRERLREAGYPEEESLMLALRMDIDLHVAVDLLARGCTVALAVQILT